MGRQSYDPPTSCHHRVSTCPSPCILPHMYSTRSTSHNSLPVSHCSSILEMHPPPALTPFTASAIPISPSLSDQRSQHVHVAPKRTNVRPTSCVVSFKVAWKLEPLDGGTGEKSAEPDGMDWQAEDEPSRKSCRCEERFLDYGGGIQLVHEEWEVANVHVRTSKELYVGGQQSP
ncbi:hypothetical protein PILCRDRAFT_484388 [Piloderma croceum F 1598]|uniref:Uncharacterized protein n=1 Tax=Piloderma croceum (strain F 1598) TaxID=765440 RepID=A0A0C3FBK6_PILCF|nr:hypothetical protein PILCRDRAFT_484388 [Piloderma croceum F 1598]